MCTAYIHIPQDERGKLDPKTKKCDLLGYGSVQKGYRVYDHLTQTAGMSSSMSETGRPLFEEDKPSQRPVTLDSVDESDCEGGDEKESRTDADTPAATEPPYLPERGSQWTTMDFHKLTSRFAVNPLLLIKQLPAQRKPSGKRLWARR